METRWEGTELGWWPGLQEPASSTWTISELFVTVTKAAGGLHLSITNWFHTTVKVVFVLC